MLSILFAPSLPNYINGWVDLRALAITTNDFFYLIRVIYIAALIFVLINVVVTKKAFISVLRTHLFVSGIVSLLGLGLYLSYILGINKAGIGIFPAWVVPRLKGFCVEPQAFGNYLLSSLPIVLVLYCSRQRFFARKTLGLLLGLETVALIFTFSLGAIAAFGLILLMVLVYSLLSRSSVIRRKVMVRYVGVLALVLCVITLAVPQAKSGIAAMIHNACNVSGSVNVRMGFFIVALREFAAYPILGVGPGKYGYFFYDFNQRGIRPEVPIQPPQNLYLGTLANLGILGFLTLMLTFFALVRILVRAYSLSDPHWKVVITAFMVAIFSLLIQHNALWIPYSYKFWTIIGFGLAASKIPIEAEKLVPQDFFNNWRAHAHSR